MARPTLERALHAAMNAEKDRLYVYNPNILTRNLVDPLNHIPKSRK